MTLKVPKLGTIGFVSLNSTQRNEHVKFCHFKKMSMLGELTT